jgi:hypothetical protein
MRAEQARTGIIAGVSKSGKNFSASKDLQHSPPVDQSTQAAALLR